MNIAQPVGSSLESVEFTFLSADEIRSISVKRIENDSTFDSLLNPVPGGLYDPALGSWGDSLCRTCNLNQAQCPGHPGHIELPVPVYHPVFMDQAYRLLRAQCVYCHRFRLPRHEVHRYICMLRLLQVGLLREAQMVDSFSASELGEQLRNLRLSDVPGLEDDEAEEEGGNLHDSAMRAREAYVRQVLREHQLKVNVGDIRRGKHEGAAEMRRALVKEFLASLVKEKRCRSCDGISPVYRKDRWVKIFERDLSEKERAAMAQAGRKRIDALAMSRKAKKHSERNPDEGIADVDSSEESVGEPDSEGEGEELDENGDVVMVDAPAKAQKGKSRSARPAQRYLSPMEVRMRLEMLFKYEQEVLSLLYSSKPRPRNSKPLTADMFFISTLLVPPNRYRPEARMGDSQISEAQQNSLYKMVLRSASMVAQISREINTGKQEAAADEGTRSRDMSSLIQAWTELQDAVNSLIDRDKNPVQGAAAKRNEEGIKQKLEKKEGLFRKNMMGKRVNFAARSVISPDPNIETNEIGVPPVFARKLTYPEPVTSHNFKDLQQAVINGVDKWPGASAIENENGQIINLRAKSLEDRVSLANQLLAPTGNNFSGVRNKKVHRHLTNGDVVLMNRQPTLHKPSIMGHRVRVLPGEKTIRMHYANCNTYNADFDGDEMNMHFPQNEIARAEALQLADTDHQYISGTAGNPLRGLIQDHLSVSVELCSKDVFLSQSEYQQLIYTALRPESGHITGERIELVPPAVIKPVPRWTGKQVITTILKNIRPADCGDLWMNGSAKIKGSSWGEAVEEGQVVFRDGEFISGILDKSQLGPSAGGFIHAVHEVYGPSIAGKLLSGMGRLLTRYLAMVAFTCGMDDLRMTAEGEKVRKETIKAASRIGLEVASKYVSLEEQKPTKDDPLLLERLEEVLRDDKKQEGLELLTSQACAKLSSEITRLCLPAGLEKQFPKNHMQSMTISGAKGSPVNANLISCNLGQQVLEGRRVPVMVSGKTLPSFKPYDTDVRAGGYIVQRFLTGIRPQEYYFHHMAGREGLIDTAVKTSRSGYLQRCLIKGMEGLRVAYDSSVRDSDGTVVQFLFGEDGIDISKQRYLNDFEFVLRNLDSQLPQIRYHEPGTQALFEHKDEVVKRMKSAIRSSNSRSPLDPVASQLDPSAFGFATSERFFSKMSDYVKTNKDGLIKEKKGSDNQNGQIARKTAEKILAAKYIRSLVEPGEAVGIVAGQSVGEPSTQMTLNTFHLAGHSAKNVTLGIPRLREILMTASANISTPSMTLVLNEELSVQDGERFAKSISVLPLAHVTKDALVKEDVGPGRGYALAKKFRIRLRFFEAEEYTKMYAIDITDVLNTVERKCIPLLCALTKKEIKKKLKQNTAATPDIGVKAGVVETAPGGAEREGPVGGGGGGGGGDDDDDDDEGDDDATSAKQRANRSEAVSYGPNDEDDDAIQKQLQRETEDVEIGEEPLEFVDEAYGGSPEPEDDLGDKTDEARSRTRTARIMNKNEPVSDFRCDEARGEWAEFVLEFDASIPKILMLSLVQAAVRKSLIQQIHRLGSATFEAKKTLDEATGQEHVTEMLVHTEGANLRAMQQYGDYINPNRIATNDIAQVLEVYGVEACRGNIVRELSNVFSSHAIAVDPRHLNLIADYMTRNGGFTPFNRIGLTGNVSPFTKMSYETTVGFLKDAVLDGDWDSLVTPSSRLVVGKLGTMGTGSFDVLTRVPTEHKISAY